MNKSTNPYQSFGKEGDLEVRIRKLERVSKNFFFELNTKISNLEKRIVTLENKNG